MNYEDKYKSALGWIRSIYPTMQGADKEDAEHYFPELRESEDERIKKEIVKLVQFYYGSTLACKHTVSMDDMVAWLEKKKDCIKLPDSAYTSNRDVIEFADKYSHTVWEKLMDKFKKIENYSIGCNDVSDIVLNAIINTYNWLEKQGEKKDTVTPQWMIDFLKEHRRHFATPMDYDEKKETDGGLVAVIKWLEGNPQLEQKSAWSEEDNPHYDDICEILINLLHSETANVNKNAVQKDLDWLKSLKDRVQPNNWKPSEEQLMGMEIAINVITDNKFYVAANHLKSLYNDLKSL